MSGRRFLKYGTPLMLLVVGGSVGLKEFQQLKFDYRGAKGLDREEARAAGIKVKASKDVTLESVMEKIDTIDTDNWENKRGPRPWEEDNELFQEALKRSQDAKEAPAR